MTTTVRPDNQSMNEYVVTSTTGGISITDFGGKRKYYFIRVYESAGHAETRDNAMRVSFSYDEMLELMSAFLMVRQEQINRGLEYGD